MMSGLHWWSFTSISKGFWRTQGRAETACRKKPSATASSSHIPCAPSSAPSKGWTFTRNTEWQSCSSRPLLQLMCSASGFNTLHQTSTLTLSSLIRLMAAITDTAVAVRDRRHLFPSVSSVIMPLPGERGRGCSVKMWHSTLNINLKWQHTSEEAVCRLSKWLWFEKVALSWEWPFLLTRVLSPLHSNGSH